MEDRIHCLPMLFPPICINHRHKSTRALPNIHILTNIIINTLTIYIRTNNHIRRRADYHPSLLYLPPNLQSTMRRVAQGCIDLVEVPMLVVMLRLPLAMGEDMVIVMLNMSVSNRRGRDRDKEQEREREMHRRGGYGASFVAGSTATATISPSWPTPTIGDRRA
jgi:hypothetical protein